MKYQDVIPTHSQNSIICTALLKKELSKAQILPVFQDFCDRIHPTVNSMRIRFPNGKFEFAMGIGAQAWDLLFPLTPKPKELRDFKEISGKQMSAVATSADLFFHIRGERMDICYEMMSIIHTLLKDVIDPVDETHGFRYRDGRAIIGFVDGTENPDPEEAADALYIDDPSDPYAGGTYVFAQKYAFDKDSWDALTNEEQEKIVGRKKWTDLELDDDDKPADAHTQISKAHNRQGDELKIMRANIVYAQPSKNIFGSYFLGYSKTFTTTHQMLAHMFQGDPAATYDSLLNYLTPETGNIFFVPTYDHLDKIVSGEIK